MIRERGVALLSVLAVLAVVLSTFFAGVERYQFQIYRVENEVNLHRAWGLAVRGLEVAKKKILLDGLMEDKRDFLMEDWAIPSYEQIGEGTIHTTIIDSGRYWNINNLVNEQGGSEGAERFRAVFERILLREELDPTLLQPLLDWLDRDDDVTGMEGAEVAEYRMEGKHFTARNGTITSLRELNLLKGWDREEIEKVAPYIHSVDGCNGQGLNVNTATESALSVLTPQWREQHTERLISRRRELPLGGGGETLDGVFADFGENFIHSLNESPYGYETNCFIVNVVVDMGKVSAKLVAEIDRESGKNKILQHWSDWSG